jgi:cysteine desulfuration protein SufE
MRLNTAKNGSDMASLDQIRDDFAFLDDWEDRYRYVIELGRGLEPLPPEAHSAANKVLGCASQVWLDTRVEPDAAGGPVLRFRGDSDAHLVRGLIAILLALYSGRTATANLDIDAAGLLDRLGLKEHLTPQRSNGVRAMVARIRREAERALAPA